MTHENRAGHCEDSFPSLRTMRAADSSIGCSCGFRHPAVLLRCNTPFRVSADAMGLGDVVQAGVRHTQVYQEPVVDVIDPAVYRELPSRLPGILDRGGVADVTDLLYDIEFAQQVITCPFVTHRIHPGLMIAVDILDMTQPVID